MKTQQRSKSSPSRKPPSDAKPDEPSQSRGAAKQKRPSVFRQVLKSIRKQMGYVSGEWVYALLLSLVPSALIFLFYRGPEHQFAFLEYFNDNALIYICVTMSAVSLITYKRYEPLYTSTLLKNKRIDSFTYFHVIFMLIIMGVYMVYETNTVVPLDNKLDRRIVIAVCLFSSFFTGLATQIIAGNNMIIKEKGGTR